MWFQKVKSFFRPIVRKLWKIIKSVVSSALEIFLAELIDFAKYAVKDLNNSDLSSDDKRKEAFNRIQKEAIGRSINYHNSWINILIEIALAAVKKEF